MKKVKLILTMVLVTGMVSLFLEACKSDSTTVAPLKVVSLKTGSGTALDGATSTVDVATNTTVVATFDKEIDATTANSNSIAIVTGGVAVPATITTAGTAVTIAPTNLLANGTTYVVSVASTLKGKDGSPAPATEFSFKTFGRANVTPPQASNQVSYFSFSGAVKDDVGTHQPAASDIKDVAFVADRFGFAGLAADFNGTTSIAEIPNGEQYLATTNFTASFWLKANSAKEGQFVIGLAGSKGFQFEIQGGAWTSDNKGVAFAAQYAQASGGSDGEGVDWNGTLNGWQGSTFSKVVVGPVRDIFKDKWAHVVYTFTGASKVGTLYVNGEKVRSIDFNLWPAGPGKATINGMAYAGTMGGGNKLAFGFIQARVNPTLSDTWADYTNPDNNHFKGQLDDVRIFKVALTAAEVTTLYTAEKP